MEKHFKRQVEIPVNATTVDQFNFPNDQGLQTNAFIEKIEAFRIANVAQSKNGKPNVADNVFNVASLTIESKEESGEIRIDSMPLSTICRADNSGIVEMMNIPAINVTQCFIKVSDKTNLDNTTAFVLFVHYRRK